ncbi:MAG: biotin/lipoyl-binding protein [Chloroflexi bacterium]|nr:MAG: biotin/lipoyl-binding protein [Chloroflexota bacterium]
MGSQKGAGPPRRHSDSRCARRGPRDAIARRAARGAGRRSRVGAGGPRGRSSLMRYEVTLDDRLVRVELADHGRFTIDDRAVAADIRETVRGRQWSITVDGESHEITVVTHDPLRLDVDGHDVRATVVDERALRANRGAAGTRSGRVELRAPMPGLLKAVHVKEGDRVAADAPLATLEAMKMENELLAPSAGRIVKVGAAAGAKVEAGAVLIVIASD